MNAFFEQLEERQMMVLPGQLFPLPAKPTYSYGAPLPVYRSVSYGDAHVQRVGVLAQTPAPVTGNYYASSVMGSNASDPIITPQYPVRWDTIPGFYDPDPVYLLVLRHAGVSTGVGNQGSHAAILFLRRGLVLDFGDYREEGGTLVKGSNWRLIPLQECQKLWPVGSKLELHRIRTLPRTNFRNPADSCDLALFAVRSVYLYDKYDVNLRNCVGAAANIVDVISTPAGSTTNVSTSISPRKPLPQELVGTGQISGECVFVLPCTGK